MPRVPSTSPATGLPTPPSYLHTTACNFVDNAGRTVLLRGVNLSGATKAPVGHLSHLLDDFWESAEAGGESFVGRPLNLDDGSADIHLARLRGWGFNFLRFPFTWEALEHEGPGIYDEEYMDYTVRVLQRCREFGFRVLMDPHQDTWSRFSGGSGAPFWTLAACGINPSNITATQSAIIHCEYPLSHAPDPASLPAMVWSTNYGRLLSQTLFTLFFAGRTFAPKCIIDGLNIQDYLQNHYIEACGRLADRIRAHDGGRLYEECVVGWDTLNEPFEGLCGWEDLNANPTKQGSTLKKGTYPTPAQSFRLGMGQAQTVEHWTFGALGPSRDGMVTVDPKGLKVWADGRGRMGRMRGGGWKRDVGKWPLGTCVWALHGVWDVETGFVLRPDYFRFDPETGVEVEFITDFWKPHFLAYKRRIAQAHEEAVWFVQPPVFAFPPEVGEEELRGRCAYSCHYYDGLTLLTRHWNWFNADALGLLRGKYSSTLPAVKIGEPAIRRSLQDQLGMLKSDAKILGDYPTLVGEIGAPFDMDGKKSYGWTDGGKYRGDYSQQEKALDASLNACDGPNGLSWTVWTFVPDDHSHEWGDGWNMEDLSLWSPADVWERERRERARQGGTKNRKRNGQPRPSLAMMAAASSLSLATLGTATLASPLALLGWHKNPFDFLSDGARAVKAFCRPYAERTVGVPVRMDFDVGKGVFRLVVSVGAEDRPEEGLATEIYVPLIHYAHARLLDSPSRKRWAAARSQAESSSSSSSTSSSSSEDGESLGSSPVVPGAAYGGGGGGMPTESKVALIMKQAEESGSANSVVRGVAAAATAAVGGIAPSGTAAVVDVEVKVSEGTWRVEGQRLLWWYDVPEGPPEGEVVIEIRRRGGPVKMKEVNARREGWCGGLCEEGCRVM
ncbi:glycoside hydrolase family 5 protein [Ephemerocybe angulata]|uniref:Glycoside hydrolase family 5 protein n=1 Tax=Ephemerocybe angulata TaxID=980116 RepID=A0A8H6IHW4_9AGAR|nr:glycoside hydrolase family 5 protein [Tulosesus angulatus]